MRGTARAGIMPTLKVCESRCDQCLFSKDRIVSAARVRDIIQQCATTDSYFECHKHTMAGEHAQCRGWYDTQPENTYTQLAGRLGLIEFVLLPAAEVAE